jgi:septum formation protein
MEQQIILASGSAIRRSMLANAGVQLQCVTARVDEATISQSMQSQGAGGRDIADTLAQQKARKIARKNPQALVIGCDQVLELNGTLLQKPTDHTDAIEQLRALSAHEHRLYAAAVIYDGETPVWRHIGVARMHMRKLGDDFIKDYVAKNWSEIQHCVGCYQIEAAGAALFNRIDGDYFSVLGLPLLELLGYLRQRGALEE